MRVFGEFPNVAEESGLWQILEANVPQKYYLSARACAGVLRRAERRGKELPTILKTALEQQIERWEKYGTPLPRFVCNVREKEIYDARGNGDGQIVPTITGDHNNRITDYTALCAEAYIIDPLSSNSMKSNNPHSGFHKTDIAKCLDTSDGSPNKNQGGTVIVQSYVENSSGDGISGTIDASYYKGVGSREGKEREFVCIKCFSQDAYDKYTETKQSATLKATGGVYGGGSEALVCAGFHPKAAKTASISYREGEIPTLQSAKEVGVVYCLQGNGIDRADTAGCNGKGVTENVSYTLNTVDRHAVCCEAECHTHDFLVRMREGKDGGGKGALVQEDKSGTIACNNDQVLFQHTQTQYVVRRLTPLECCRLQGMPDGWCADVPHSDAQEYRMWGNGMALPNALYIMEGLVESDEK